MTKQEPEYLSQGVNYLGFLSQQLGDLRGITTLAHELIQNADDAKDEAGELSATLIIFDIRDDAFIVSNDAVFREVDFERMQEVAGGSKRSEAGDRTTGAFGVGFISVFQVTDRPEIESAGRRWILRPEEQESRRIAQTWNRSITEDKGTVFRLPWAYEDSHVRQELKVSPVSRGSLDSFTDELRESLPSVILFLKKIETIELRRNGKKVSRVTRVTEGNDILIDCDGVSEVWRVINGAFQEEALDLKRRFPSIEKNREPSVRLAIPHAFIDEGLLFATLPTMQPTGLPFHLDADFFPTSDRKSIPFEDSNDHRSEWNRAAIRAAAAVLEGNLVLLRDMFRQDASAFWAILDCLRQIHSAPSNSREPLGAFWEALLPSLQTVPIVHAESGKWFTAAEVRIAAGDEQWKAVPAFCSLGIEMVHPGLRSYRNVLTSKAVGVGMLTVNDVYEAFDRIGMVGCIVNDSPLSHDDLALLRSGIHTFLENLGGDAQKQEAETLLSECALAPGLDDYLWPCQSVYVADARTCEVFADVLSDGITFLAERGTPLLEELCVPFEPHSAIAELEKVAAEDIQEKWQNRNLDPVALLRWFDSNKVELSEDQDLRGRLASIPLFPSAGKLHRLSDLWIPGGFDDPLGVAGLVDMNALSGLSDFLRSLGAMELTFAEFAARYVPEALADGGNTNLMDRHRILEILEKHIGEIRDDKGVKNKLARTNIVECEDGEFRRPNGVYFPYQEIRTILANGVNYAFLSEGSDGRSDLYQWLGVAAQPRPEDILRLIDDLKATSPDQKTKKAMVNTLEAVNNVWAGLPDDEKEKLSPLKSKDWLPAENDHVNWYNPDQLYATFNKSLFESQAQFLDVPLRSQQRISEFLSYLGVKLNPQPLHIVRHLIERSKNNVTPPNGIYQWLNNIAQSSPILELRNLPCLRVNGKYFRPDEVFWGRNPFGRFRVQLGPDFRSYQNLLLALGVRETPDHNDALKVLRDITAEIGNNTLVDQDKDVVTQCWVELSEALQHGDITAESIEDNLRNTPCIPNSKGRLLKPSWMFLEDVPRLADKFPGPLGDNLVLRMEHVWKAMEAAGVRPISEVVLGSVNDPIGAHADEGMKKRITQRSDLIRAILEGVAKRSQPGGDGIPLDDLRLFVCDELIVEWELHAFDRRWPPNSSRESAHLDGDKKAIYFTLQDEHSPPWAAIARELTRAIAPGEEIGPIASGLKILLEVGTYAEAVSQLEDLGIARIHGLGRLENRGDIAEGFEEEPVSEHLHEQLIYTGDKDMSGGGLQDIPPERTLEGRDEREVPFAKRFYEVQTVNSSIAIEREVRFPEEGPQTKESAAMHTEQSGKFGRSGAHVRKRVVRWEPTEAANELADEFINMVHGDYGRRCQICSRTFTIPNGPLQVFVVHVVPPSADHRTNNFGDLLGLCGWHYSLIRYGEWALLDPETKQPFENSNGYEGWKRMRDFASIVPQRTDPEGNSYVSFPVRFWNVYQEWKPTPTPIDEEIRFSIPHWIYLQELLSS